jgi:hypothetical protein
MKDTTIRLVSTLAAAQGWDVSQALNDAKLWIQNTPQVSEEESILEWYEETVNQGAEFSKDKQRQDQFYTVSACFDMSQYGDVAVKSFLKYENAKKWAALQVQKFLKEIPNNGALDDDASMDHSDHELFYYYGVSADGENFVTVQVEETTFADQEEK